MVTSPVNRKFWRLRQDLPSAWFKLKGQISTFELSPTLRQFCFKLFTLDQTFLHGFSIIVKNIFEKKTYHGLILPTTKSDKGTAKLNCLEASLEKKLCWLLFLVFQELSSRQNVLREQHLQQPRRARTGFFKWLPDVGRVGRFGKKYKFQNASCF